MTLYRAFEVLEEALKREVRSFAPTPTKLDQEADERFRVRERPAATLGQCAYLQGEVFTPF